MIQINNKELSQEDENIVLMALHHYELIWMNNSDFTKKVCNRKLNKIKKIIDTITRDYKY